MTHDGVSGQTQRTKYIYIYGHSQLLSLHTVQPSDSEQLVHKWTKASAHKAVWVAGL